MSVRPVRSVLDAALRSLAMKEESPDATLVPVPLEALAALRAAAAPPPIAPPQVSIKLLTQAGREDDAADWIRAAGGRVGSAGPQVRAVAPGRASWRCGASPSSTPTPSGGSAARSSWPEAGPRW